MNIKTVCKLDLKTEEGFLSYTDYEVYPLAAIFAESDDAALAPYISKMTSPHIEIQECFIMEATLAYGETLRFRRVKGQNTTFNHEVVTDYLIIAIPFIGS